MFLTKTLYLRCEELLNFMARKIILIILDGWGIAKNTKVSAIDQANTPFIDSLYETCPHSTLRTSGLDVGLPDGQMGNSEVGHLNIGAGRIVYQDLVKVSKAIEDGTVENHEVLNDAFDYAKANDKKVHLFGLVSDGGVHSHIDHLKGLMTIAAKKGIKNLFIHAFTDGRDTDPKSGIGFITQIIKHGRKTSGRLASVVGRYYAMDRDKRWERVKLAYDCLVFGKGNPTTDVIAAINDSYSKNITDEFLKPLVLTDDKSAPVATIQEGDVVICFNFRTDRGRQITQVLTQFDLLDFEMKKLSLYYVTLTNYDNTFQNIKVIFDKDNLEQTLGEVLSERELHQIRVAETEKYPHVTYFFSGGREKEFKGEKRILCPSPKVATYDLKPEMSAEDVRDRIVAELRTQWADFVCLNFANADMVGHTGVFEAAIKGCETVDKCTKDVVETGLENGYSSIIIADHGNSDYMINEDGTPNTAHTTNPVPCILVDKSFNGKIKNGRLADVAPTILQLMDIPKPSLMTGESLIDL